MKILITSDNHLGYKETDVIRQNDSFCTFDEILQLGVINKVDLILQVGDLFHENRPSRYCINRTINILRKHLVDEVNESELKNELDYEELKNELDYKDIKNELDYKDIKNELDYKDIKNELDYEDIKNELDYKDLKNVPLTFKVKTPFLCIHGNHDDPSGFNKISTLDILHSAGLVKYIGKSSTIVDFVQFNNVRIYGVGYVKDKDVTKVFKNLQFKDLSSLYFNILLVHQNRVPRNKDFLCPSSIPNIFNLLIYGHEHDPIIIRNETLLLQCGSTVRTSLSEAECNDKYSYILDTEDFSLSKIKLNSVRPFIMEDTILNEEKDLIDYIKNLLENIKSNNLEDNKRYKVENDKSQINIINIHNPLIYPTLLPLIRLRVLTTNTLNINKNRLSHIFKDKVSNPSEIIKLIPHKKVKGKENTIIYKSQNITEIIVNHLKCTPLECIPEYKFLEHFKKDSNFLEMIEENLEEFRNNIQYDNCLISDLGQEIKKIKMSLCNLNKNDVIFNNEEKSISSDHNINLESNSLVITEESSNDNVLIPSILTSKDSKTLRKTINNRSTIKNATFINNNNISDIKGKNNSNKFINDNNISDIKDNNISDIKDNSISDIKDNSDTFINNIGDTSKNNDLSNTSKNNDLSNTIKNNDLSNTNSFITNEKNIKSDFSKAGSSLFFETTSDVRKIYEEESDSTDLLIDF